MATQSEEAYEYASHYTQKVHKVMCSGISFRSPCLFRHHKDLQLKTERPQRASRYLPGGLGGGRDVFHFGRFGTGAARSL